MTIRALVAALALLVVAAPAGARPGELDRRYGSGGVAKTARLEGGSAGVLGPGGTLVVAGGSVRPGVARLTARGRLDRRFGHAGVLYAAAGLGPAIVTDVRRDRDGTIRAAAMSASLRTPPLLLLTFGARRANAPVAHVVPFIGPAADAALRPGGGAVLVNELCRYPDACTRPVLVRAVNRDGTLDTAFGGGTVDVCGLLPAPCPGITAVTVAPDGKVLVAVARYSLQDGSTSAMRLLRLTRQGTLDRAFGRGGAVRLPFAGTVVRARRGGAVAVAGPGARRRLARVARFSAAGARVRAFGASGVAQVGRRDRRAGQAIDLVTDGAGRIHVLASRLQAYGANSGNERRPFIVRLTRRGTADRRFGRRGTAALPEPDGGFDTTEGNALVLDRRGGLLVVTKLFTRGERDPIFGCDFRDDICAERVRLGVWRLRTR